MKNEFFTPSQYQLEDKCESTNTELKLRLLNKKAVIGDVFITKEQTKGRGRLDHTWISPMGNLAFSFILPVPNQNPQLAYQLNLLIGLSLTKTVQEVLRINGDKISKAQQKWPNDVLIDKSKIAGILSEVIFEENAVIVGVGVNLNSTRSDFPIELQSSLSTIKDIVGHDVDEKSFLQLFFDFVRQDYELYSKKWLSALLSEIHSVLAFRGEWIKISEDNSIFEAQITGVSENGRLRVLLKSGETRELISGEVVFK